jgi:p25-alpha
MDGKTFAKFAKDCKILDKKLTATDIDLIFAKVKDKTARRITLPQFLNGINECAAKKGITVEALKEKIC